MGWRRHHPPDAPRRLTGDARLLLSGCRSSGATEQGERATIHMPAGLIEGAETTVLFTLMLAVPSRASDLFVVMAVLVAVTIGQRVVWAVQNLS